MSTPVSAVSQSPRFSSQSRPNVSRDSKPMMESMKLVYKADQQVKVLHLHAEIDTLLLELQTLKQQRRLSSPVEASDLEVALKN